MRRSKVWGVGLVGVLILGLAGSASAAASLKSVIKKVDAKIYYPQELGMRSLQADVASSYLQERMQEQGLDANAVKMTHYWARPYKQRFRITGVPEAAQEGARQVERQLSMWGERLVPKPLALTLKDYKCKLTETEKTYVIDARTTAPSAFIWAMKFTIDKKSSLPTQWRMSTDNFDADIEIQYEALPTGKHYAKLLKVQADGTDLKIQREHKVFGQFFLVETLTVIFTGDDGSENKSTMKLSNFQFNKPIPKGTFPPEKK